MTDNDLIRRGDALAICGTIIRNDEAARVEGFLSAIPAAQPTVKPLVWKQAVIPEQAMQGTWWKAAAMTGDYEVHRFNDRDEILLQRRGLGNPVYPTIEAAKAAAQADFEARILSALDMQPTVSPDVAVLVEALRQIAKQKRTDELDTEYDVDIADFEGGYDEFINRARVALARVKEGM